MRKQTKAERIYKDTYYACKRHIETWGFDGAGFNRMATDEAVYQRTVNEIKRLIKADVTDNKMAYKYGIITREEAEKRVEIIKMVIATLKNQYIS